MKGICWMVGLAVGLGVTSLGAQVAPGADSEAVVQIDFKNAQLQPPHWVLEFNRQGVGRFDSDGTVATKQDSKAMNVGDIHRPVKVSEAFAARVFAVAQDRRLFAFPCESHMKVAYQGTKRLSYRGPEGTGSCEYNYSKDKPIQALGESLLAVENTILSGARLEKLLQHDRLGLDEELESLVTAAHEGNALEMGTIRETLTKIIEDEQVMDRARRKARGLLATAVD